MSHEGIPEAPLWGTMWRAIQGPREPVEVNSLRVDLSSGSGRVPAEAVRCPVVEHPQVTLGWREADSVPVDEEQVGADAHEVRGVRFAMGDDEPTAEPRDPRGQLVECQPVNDDLRVHCEQPAGGFGERTFRPRVVSVTKRLLER